MVVTFVTDSDLVLCAKNLDNKRLNKQKVEAMQIINTLEGTSTAWQHHPIIKMWEGHEDALKVYYNHIVRECINRKINNTMPFYDIDESEYFVLNVIFDGKETKIEKKKKG